MNEQAAKWDQMMALREALKQAHRSGDAVRVAAILEEVRQTIEGREGTTSAANAPGRAMTARRQVHHP